MTPFILLDAYFLVSLLLLLTAVGLIISWLRKGDLSGRDLLAISALTLTSIALIRLPVDPIGGDFITRLMNCILRGMQTVALEENLSDIVDEIHLALAGYMKLILPEGLQGAEALDWLRSTAARTFRGTSYAIYASVQYVLAPVICGLALVEVLGNLVGGLRERWCHRPVYVFSQLNKESLLLAESIANTREHALICFFDASQEQQSEYRARLRQIDAIVHEDEVQHRLFPRHSPCVTCLVSTGNEGENLNTLSRLLEEGCKDRPGRRLKYFVLAHSIQAEHLTDRLAKQYIAKAEYPQDVRLICMINPEENLVGHILMQHPLHESAGTSGKSRRLNVLILGSGHLAEHMLRNVFASGQMIGCSLSITVAAKEHEAFQARMEAAVPMLLQQDTDLMKELGGIAFTGLASPAAAGSLAADKEFDYILCALDSDADNIRAARQLRIRIDQQKLEAAAQPKPGPRAQQPVTILCVVKDPSMNALCASAESPVWDYGAPAYTPCGLYPVGSNAEQYSADVIFSNELMHRGFFVDRAYSGKLAAYDNGGKPDSMMDDFIGFMNSAYNRRSSIAGALQIPYRSSVLSAGADGKVSPKTVQQLAQAEHRRWTAYTIMDGFTRPTDDQMKALLFRGNSNTKDVGLLLHPCLVRSGAVPLNDPFTEPMAEPDELELVSLTIHELILDRVKAIFEANGLDAAKLTRTENQSADDHKEDLLKEAGKLQGATKELALKMIRKLYNNFRSSDFTIVQDTGRIVTAADAHRETLEAFWQDKH